MTEQVNFHRRRAGLSVPLSALNSEHGLGIGDTAALERFFDWMNEAGLSVLQLLPLNDLGPGDSCPYAGMSALAFDALAYADPLTLPELRSRAAGEGALRRAAGLRKARRVGFAAARALKREAFLEAFRSFERSGSPERREAFGCFRGSNDDWLDEYALFRALKEESGWTPWQSWEPEIRDFKAPALAAPPAPRIVTRFPPGGMPSSRRDAMKPSPSVLCPIIFPSGRRMTFTACRRAAASVSPSRSGMIVSLWGAVTLLPA